MNKYNHVLTFDLTSYGSALSIINQFVDDKSIKVFEISPCGQAAILILVAEDFISLQIIKSEALSVYRSQILEFSIIENIHGDVLPTYLSQNKFGIGNSLAILEGASVAKALYLADQLVKNKNSLIDLRVIRTNPKSVILTIAPENLNYFDNFDGFDFKKTYIENIQPSLKAFYEI